MTGIYGGARSFLYPGLNYKIRTFVIRATARAVEQTSVFVDALLIRGRERAFALAFARACACLHLVKAVTHVRHSSRAGRGKLLFAMPNQSQAMRESTL